MEYITVNIRPMEVKDLAAVLEIEKLCFCVTMLYTETQLLHINIGK